jgi:hypothetical protein
MKPTIDGTDFGSVTIAGETYEHDVVIRLDGGVIKRKKKLSKEIFGSSHTVSLPEAEFIYEEGADRLIFGTGQSGLAGLSAEAAAFFQKKNCRVELLPTPAARQAWNRAPDGGAVIGLFHVTC